jgi:prepilin-type N-terminal cleavage/methylation domain-containing protein
MVRPYSRLRQIFFRSRGAFTLIELLVVIAIIAVLATVVVLVLNPIELLRQSRDSNRMSDLATINTALAAYDADQSSGFMGTSTVVYVSIPDSTSTCANLGLPTLPSGYTYGCSTPDNYRKTDGTGWVPVNLSSVSFGAPLPTLPIDPINTTSTNQYYTYITGGSWKLTAISLESQKYATNASNDGGSSQSSYEIGSDLALGSNVFPSGWIEVPGDSTFGTSDFWVMKYEAKCILASTNASLTSPTTGYNTYENDTTPCTGSSYYIASTPDGYPIANIDQTTSATYCAAIGAHLITNNEWQTIAWNAQNTSSNWSGGSPGSGYIYSGHNDNVPGSALVASTDDADEYFGTGQSAPSNQRRTLTLSNDSVIWDLAGNVYDWTNDAITGANQPYAAPSGFAWRELSSITDWGTMTQETIGAVNSSWNATNGIGRIYSSGNAAHTTAYGFMRGSYWNGGTYAGTEGLILNHDSTYTNLTLGFRCAR